MRWPGSAESVTAKPPRVETLAARQIVPQSTPLTTPFQSNTHTKTEYTVYIHRPSIIQTQRFTEALTHLSTESKVFFRGGGRALTFLGVGHSLSVCGGGRAGSVADGGGRGEEGRDSFHPACTGNSIQAFYSRTQRHYMCTTAQYFILVVFEVKARM